jgi:hypothetical protein
MNPLYSFLTSCLTYKYEIGIGLLVFVVGLEVLFFISGLLVVLRKFVVYVLEFELEKIRLKYFNKK